MTDPIHYIDISPTISPSLAVWPGDQPFTRNVALDFKKGDHLVLSSIQSTVHLGSHADAPSHYHADGVSIEKQNLSYYMGPCQVIKIEIKRGGRIQRKHFESIELKAPRILIATNSYPDPDRWNEDFNSLSPELVHYLADHNVILVGIDTPSVDPAESKALEAHQAIYQRKLAILEGLVLSHVKEGLYHLVALPLKIAEADASPVRAVLLPPSERP